MSIGERITELRKQKNISQVQLAKQLEVSRQAVSKWENDQTAPDTLKLIQLADLLDTDVEFLATGKHSVRTPPPTVVTVEKVVDNVIEKVIEKPVYIEKIVEVEKIVEKVVEKPVIRKVFRARYLRNPIEYLLFGGVCFLLGLLLGWWLGPAI